MQAPPEIEYALAGRETILLPLPEMTRFHDFLSDFQLTPPDLEWEPFREALARLDEGAEPPEGVGHQPLFTIVRGSSSPLSGSERNFAGLFTDAHSDDAMLYFADDAGGVGKLWPVDANDDRAIQSLISKNLDEWGWSPLQLYDTMIYNQAPERVPRDFFVRLAREAFDRRPDLIDAWDTVYNSPEHLVEEIYEEW